MKLLLALCCCHSLLAAETSARKTTISIGGDAFDDGYQGVSLNWRLSSGRKRGFFKLLAEITGSSTIGEGK